MYYLHVPLSFPGFVRLLLLLLSAQSIFFYLFTPSLSCFVVVISLNVTLLPPFLPLDGIVPLSEKEIKCMYIFEINEFCRNI